MARCVTDIAVTGRDRPKPQQSRPPQSLHPAASRSPHPQIPYTELSGERPRITEKRSTSIPLCGTPFKINLPSSGNPGFRPRFPYISSLSRRGKREICFGLARLEHTVAIETVAPMSNHLPICSPPEPATPRSARNTRPSDIPLPHIASLNRLCRRARPTSPLPSQPRTGTIDPTPFPTDI